MTVVALDRWIYLDFWVISMHVTRSFFLAICVNHNSFDIIIIIAQK